MKLLCLGVPEPRSFCRELLELPEASEEKELVSHLQEKGVTDLLIVNVMPLLTDERYRVRAFVREVHVAAKKLETTRTYGAIYDSRAPEALIKAKDSTALTAFWQEGTPTRIEREATASVPEIERLLLFLNRGLAADKKTSEFWTALQPIDALEESGRAKCSGIAVCGSIRLVRDFGSRLWISSARPFTKAGILIASLDEISAKHSTDMMMFAVTLEWLRLCSTSTYGCCCRRNNGSAAVDMRRKIIAACIKTLAKM